MSGPTHSNRNFKVMKTIEIPQGEYIIEVWDASNWDKDTRERTPVPGAKDINWYKKDPTKDYNKGDFVTKIRVFKNEDNPQIPLHQKSSSEGISDGKIPF